MTWLKHLYDTYEKNIGKPSDIPLVPISHMAGNAHVEVTITNLGEFKTASIVDKKDMATIIPITEVSGIRSSNVAPHPLSDMLPYIAGEFPDYCKTEKEKKTAKEKFTAYIQNLEKWADSDYNHPKVTAIYSYLSKKQLIMDLINTGILTTDTNGYFGKEKINGQTYDKVMVRFRVEGDKPEATWEDDSLIQNHIAYYRTIQTNRKDICYFTGQEEIISQFHPKGIVPFEYGAKLISVNDKVGYTFRGQFETADEAFALSYEVSQKIHSALTWLIRKYGVKPSATGKRVFLCWNPDEKPIPNFLKESPESADTEVNYRKKLKKTLLGYTNEFTDEDPILVMAFDAVTKGRLSITYYQESPAVELLENVRHWKETCNWAYLKFTEDSKPYWEVETPVFHRIIACAFGREQGNFIEVDDQLLAIQSQRLLSCMLERNPIPFDMVQAITNRASLPLCYGRGNRERVLSTACAVIRKYQYDKTKEVTPMKLDVTNHNRSYLFGRLLAVYEKVERRTYDPGETRDPNAIRLQSVFSNNPMTTWNTLDKAVNPYFQKLRPGTREYFRKMISEITLSFEETDPERLNQKLEPDYLLGYYLQRAELNKTKEDPKTDETSESAGTNEDTSKAEVAKDM